MRSRLGLELFVLAVSLGNTPGRVVMLGEQLQMPDQRAKRRAR